MIKFLLRNFIFLLLISKLVQSYYGINFVRCDNQTNLI